MRRHLWLKIILSTLGVLVLALVLGFAFLHTDRVKEYALSRLRDYLFETQGIRLQAGEIDYNLLTLSASLQNVRAQSELAPDMPPFLVARRLDVDLGTLSLIRGFLHVESARVEGAQVHVVIGKDGRTNLPTPVKEQVQEESGGLPDFLIEKLSVPSASVKFEDLQQGIDLELPAASIQVTGRETTLDHLIGIKQERRGSISLDGRTLPIDVFDARARVPADLENASLEASRLVTGNSEINTRGTVNNLKDPVLDVTVSANVDAAPLAHFAGLGEPVSGRVTGEVKIHEHPENLRAEADISGRRFSYRDFSDVDFEARSRWIRGEDRIVVDSLDVKSPDGSLRATADVRLVPDGRSHARVEVRNANLAALGRKAGSDVGLASRADGNLEASWTGTNPETAEGRANFQLRATQGRAGRNLVPVSGSVRVERQGQTAKVRIDRVHALNTSIEGEVTVSRLADLSSNPKGNITGNLRASSQDIAGLLSGLTGFLGRKEPLVGTRLAGPLNVEARLGGTLSSPVIDSRAELPDTEVGSLRHVSVVADTVYRGDTLGLEDVQANWSGEVLRAAGEIVGLTGRDPRLDLRADVDEASVETITKAVGRELPVTGQLSVHATAAGSMANPVIEANVRGENLVASREPLGTLNILARVRDRLLRLEELKLTKPNEAGGGELSASGTYNLDTRQYQAEAHTRDLRLVGLTIGEGVPIRGQLDLNASGNGTIDNPSADLQLRSQDLTIQDRPVGSMVLNARAENQKVALDLRADRYRMAASGEVQVPAPHQARFRLSAQNTDLSLLPTPLAESGKLRGNFTAEVNGEGTIANWKEGTISANIGQMAVIVNGQQIAAKTPMEVTYRNGLLEVPSAEITASDSRLTLGGSLPLRPDVNSPGLEVRGRINLATVKDFFPAPEGLAASGILELDARLHGSLEQLNPEVRLSLANGSVQSPALRDPVTDLTLQAELQAGNLLLKTLSARIGAGRINVQGKVPLGLLPQKLPLGIPQAAGDGNLVADLTDFRFESLAGMPEEAVGQASAHAEFRADAARLDALTGSVRFDQLQLRLKGYDVAQQAPTRITLQSGVARVDAFRLAGTGTELNIDGSVQLRDRTVDAKATGQADLGLIEIASEDIDAAGSARFEVQARGPLSVPEVNGFLEVTNGQISADEPKVQLTDLNTRVGMRGRTLTIEQFQGTANGGNMTGKGQMVYATDRPMQVTADLNIKGFYLEFPENLRTASDVQINLRNREGGGIVLGGQVRILEGSYTESIGVGEEVLDLLQTSSGVELTQEQNPLLARLRFNLDVDTQNPIAVDNNLAEVLATADLRLTGNYYRPGLTGRLSIEEGGELHLRERNYVVERGIVTFLNETRIEPSLDVSANTEVDNYDITLEVSGTPDDLETTLTSDPPLPEPDIISMLVTGRRLENLRGEELEVAKEQTLSLLTGGAARRLSSGLEQATGLSQVRIEPSLIASESEPSARLTVAQELRNDLELIYSMNLTDSSDQIYIAEYDVTDHFTGRVLHHTGSETPSDTDPDQNSYRLEFTHELLFGGAGETGRHEKSDRKKREIRTVSFSGTPVFPVSVLEDEFDIEIGQDFDFFEVRKGLDRLREYYLEKARLEARMRLHRRETDAQSVDLQVEVVAGPEVSFSFQGAPVPEDTQKQVREAWAEGFFDGQRIEDSQEAIRAYFLKNNYLQAQVKPSVSANGDRKLVAFDVTPGVFYSQVDIAFQGANGIEAEKLEEQVKKADLEEALRADPGEVRKFLERFYYNQGYLDAEVEDIKVEYQPEARRARIVVQILEGQLARVHVAGIRGNSVYSESELTNVLRVKEGDTYNPQAVQDSLQVIEEAYWRKGFNDVAATFVSARGKDRFVDLTFNIEENKQHIVREVVVKGRNETSENFVRHQLELKPGDILDRDKVARSRRNLYDTQAFALVDIRAEEIATPLATEREQPMRLEVSVREVRPFELQYGGSYDTERGVGLLTSIENRNSLGKARVLGALARYDGETREGRLYFSQPLLRSIPIQTSVVGFARREIDNQAGFTTQRFGVSLQQELRLKDFYVLSYGYRFERTRTIDHDPTGFDLDVTLAPLSTTLTRDTRDDLLDASRGSFNAHAFEYAPALLGSKLRYIKYYGQYFKYIPLRRPAEIPWSGGQEKSRLVYAGAIRIGLAQGLGDQELIPGERFFAGGESTVRGFREDALGPINAAGFAKGGEAVFIFNNEIRFPLISIFDGVGFVDLGNVYENVSDFNPFKLRAAVGVGLRVRTPYFLLRGDYGMKLDRRDGESAGAFFFSIGQAF